jgi:S1-C subfamily serine protease
VLVYSSEQVLKISRSKFGDSPEKALAASKLPSDWNPVLEKIPSESPRRLLFLSLIARFDSFGQGFGESYCEAVVQVRTPSGLGSGFIINEDGFLMTNFHVIDRGSRFSVEVYHQRNGQLDRKSYKQVRIIAINKFEDLALLKIDDKNSQKFKYVTLGSSGRSCSRESVFAVGSPLGLNEQLRKEYSARRTRQLAGTLYLQTTTQINPGNVVDLCST